MSYSANPQSRQTAEKNRKDTEDQTVQGTKGQGTFDTKGKTQDSTKMTDINVQDLESDDPFQIVHRLYQKVQQDLQTLHSSTGSEQKTTDALIKAERSFARLTAIERDAIYPRITELVNNKKIDQPYTLTQNFLEDAHSHIENLFTVLGKWHKDWAVMRHENLKPLVKYLADVLNSHRQLEEHIFKLINPHINEQEKKKMVQTIRDTYGKVGQEPFVPYGSMKSKVSEAINRVSGLFGSSGTQQKQQ